MRHCHETKYIRDMDLAFYSVDCWACGCLDLGRHPHMGTQMNVVFLGEKQQFRQQS
jgi:hypothetical protein